MNGAKEHAIEPVRLLALESTDSSMLYDINAIIPTDSVLIIHSRDYVRAFDHSDGRYLNNVALKGVADNEFSYVGNIWLSGDTVNIYDTNKELVLQYSAEGNFYGSHRPIAQPYRPGEKARQYYEIPGVGIITVNLSTDHTTPTNPKATFYSTGESEGKVVPGREVIEPTSLIDGVFVDSAYNRLLMWEPLRDTIFEITPEAVRPLYVVDFGDRALPSGVQQLPYLVDRVNVYNSKKDTPYASLIRYVQRKGDNIYFAFACGDEMNYMACFNTATNKTTVTRFATPDGVYSQSSCFKIAGDSAYIEVRDRKNMFANPLLYKVALTELQ